MNKLKSVTAYRTNLTSFAGDDSEEYKFYHREMDEKGSPLHVVYYSSGGEERLVEDYKYDDAGRVVEEINNHIDEERLEKNTWRYDSNGNCIEEGEYYEDELYEKSVHEYDANKRKISTLHMDADDNILERNIFEYDADGHMLKHAHYDDSGTNDWVLELKYNADGKVCEESRKDLIQGTSETTVHEFNEQGHRIHSETKDAAGELTNLVDEEYDETGNSLEVITQGKYPYITYTTRTTEYDEENRAVATQLYDEKNNYLLSKEIITYGDDGHPAEQELYELRASQGMIKTHFLLTFDNEYWD